MGAEEALQIGLANRVVDTGTARQAAEALAGEIARFPQRCLLSDRRSAREQSDFSWEEGFRNEFRQGLETIGNGKNLDRSECYPSGTP